jgi:hypothetical protein
MWHMGVLENSSLSQVQTSDKTSIRLILAIWQLTLDGHFARRGILSVEDVLTIDARCPSKAARTLLND